MTVAINPELEGKIRKWTPNVGVAGPPELRETFKQHAAKEYDRSLVSWLGETPLAAKRFSATGSLQRKLPMIGRHRCGSNYR
jgi:hypothetical protein